MNMMSRWRFMYSRLRSWIEAASWFVMLLILVGACGQPATTTFPGPTKLGIANATTLTVGILVNDQMVATVDPQGHGREIDPTTLPPLPWNVEARAISGRVLTSMRVTADELKTIATIGATYRSGAGTRVDLSCGSLRIWAGDLLPSGPAPDPSAGHPGDCAP